MVWWRPLYHVILPQSLLSYLDVQGGEVAVEVFRVIDVRLPADWTHHVSDVFVPHSDGEVLLETTAAHRALTRCQRLHLREERENVGKELRCASVLQNSFKPSRSLYLAMREDREADGTLFGQHSLDKLSVVRLSHRLHYVFQ